MKQFAVIDREDMFLSRIEFVEEERKFIPIFSNKETWFDAKTAKGCIGVLLDDCNILSDYCETFSLICKRS